MTILSSTHSSRIRNRSMGVLHLIAADESCEVSDILALLSQPSPASKAPAARMSDQPPSGMQAEDAAPQPSADNSEAIPAFLKPQPTSTPAVQVLDPLVPTQAIDVDPTSLPGAEGAVDLAPIPAPARVYTKGRSKQVEAAIEEHPDSPDFVIAEHLGCEAAYVRRTAARLGKRLASRHDWRKAQQDATNEALKASPAKPQEPVERAGPPTPRPEPKQPPAPRAAGKSLKQQVADTHREHPDWSAEQIADHIGAKLGSVRHALHDARTAAGTAEVEVIPPATPQTPVAPPPTGDTRTLTERVRALHQQHPTWTATMLAKELGAKATSVSTILSMVRGKPAAPVEQPQFAGRREMVKHYGEIAKRLGKAS